MAHGRQATTKHLAWRSTRVVTPDGLAAATVLVEGETITAIASWSHAPADYELHDFGDLVLLPGLVDTHVHINDAAWSAELSHGEPSRSHWEGFSTATAAATSGGVTTLVDMPLNCVPETLSPAALEAKRQAARGSVHTDWMSWGGLVGNDGNSGDNLEQLTALAEAGVPGFKCFLIDSGIDEFRWADEATLRAALTILAGRNLPLLVHAELAAPIVAAAPALAHADWRRHSTWLASRPDAAEVEAVALMIRLAREFDVPMHIVHVASAHALPLIAAARAEGLGITAETCAHYLTFAADEVPDGATEYKCAPPLRSAANREALWQALFSGTLDMVTTDHSPAPAALKARDSGSFRDAWGGVSSLGLALPAVWTGLRQRGGSLAHLAQWLAQEPARLARIGHQKGALAAGHHADLAVFDPEAEVAITPRQLHFRHKLSPYLGQTLRGRLSETWLRGRRIFAHGEHTAPHGHELTPDRGR